LNTFLSHFIPLLFLLIIIFSVILVWINLPGTFFFLFFLFSISFINGFDFIDLKKMTLFLIVFVFLELVEFFLSAITVKFYGGKSSSSLLSIIGGIAGAVIMNFFLPIIGVFFGLIIGSYLTVYFFEIKSGNTKKEAVKIANGVIIGYVISKGIKTLAILTIGIYIIKSIS